MMNTILAITYSFFLSFVPAYSLQGNKYVELYENSTHVNIEVGLDVCDIFHIYCGEETYQIASDTILNNVPYRQSYLIGAECHKKFNDMFNVKCGIMHKCTHPVNCWNAQQSNFNEASTEIYINVGGKFTIF